MLESLKAMPMKGKLTLAGSALGVVLVAFFLLQLATKPSYETLMSGVQPADTAKVTTALDGAGIAYELQNNGTAIAVQKGTTAEARVALASAGVDTSSTSRPVRRRSESERDCACASLNGATVSASASTAPRWAFQSCE